MTSNEYLAEQYKGLSKSLQGKVVSYFPAIAGFTLSSMAPISGVNAPFNRSCVGSDENLYAQCLADSISIAINNKGSEVLVCLDSSKTLAKMVGRLPVMGTFEDVVISLGYDGVEVTSTSYEEEPYEFDEPDTASRYNYRRSKQVPDYNGMMDDYTWYEDTLTGKHIFIFGDKELYGPEDGNYDYECESESEALEWFESYNGAEDEDSDEVVESFENKEEVYHESDDSADSESEGSKELDKVITACFGSTIPNYVSKILNTYDLLYSSGYDLRRPYGVLGNDGIYYVDSLNHSELRSGPADMDFSTSIKLYTLFQGKLGFSEKSCRSSGVIGMEIVNQYISNPSTIMYFPQKCLEIMFGRVPATAKKEANGEKIVYFARSQNINSWSAYRNQDVKQHLSKLLMQCVRVYVERVGIKDKLRTLDAVNAVNGLLNYAISCLSVAILVIDYKSFKGLPSKFKVRVSDPAGRLSAGYDYTSDIIREVFSGNMGGLESKKLSSGLNKQLSTEYKVYEYAHEFDHKVSNAVPLFAYKALEALQARGETVTWHSAIIGQAMDDTILRNGTGGINLSSALFHHINAGSRSGKGVMTLNMLASGIASGKALFYLDNKVDMGSMLASLAHSGSGNPGSVNGPDMFVVNGSNFEKDDFGEFVHRNDWIIQEHIPQEIRVLFGSPSWETLGELFYLRAYMLCLGIVFARGSDSHAKGNDPMFGGENGIMVIVDEINQVQTRMLEKATIMADVVPPLETEYQNRVDAIKAAASNEKEMSKLPKLLRSFKRQFNGASYYALSLLKSYGDCIQSIKNKSFSGFKDSEARASDIFIIGQNLEPIPVGDLNAVLKTCRYKGDTDIGLNKMSNGGNKVRTQSIPYQMTLFKSADAFIGYNGPQPAYLMQTQENSRAYGVLDKTARGFAYVPSFSTPAEGEKPALQFCSLSKANDSNTVYFKPYLILNRGDMESSYVQEMFGYSEEAGASKQDIIAEYPDDADPSRISKNVGFTEYMTLMGMRDLPARLKAGADIANHVVYNYLGYMGMPGSNLPLWLQFVTDLRIEWMFSPQDVWALCTGNSEYNLGKGINSKVTGEYYQYVKDLSELQLIGVDISDPSVTPSVVSGGDGSYSSEDAEAFEQRAGFSSTEDGSNPDAETREERERLSYAMGDSFDVGEDENLIDFDADSEDGEEEALNNMRSGMGAFNFSATNAAGSAHREGSVGYQAVSEAISPVNMDAIEAALAVLRNSGYNVTLDMGSYSVGADGKMVSDFEPAQTQTDMSSVFTGVGELNSDEAFERLVNGVTSKVINDYGGLGRVRSFAIVGDSLVINKVMYRCKIDESLSSKLYVDLRREVNAGNIIRLFNYKVLAGMTELTELKCDSVSFMYDYVNYSAFGSYDVPIRAYFDAFPKLRLLQIGKDRYTRESVYSIECESPYYIQSKGSKFFESVHDNAKKWNQGAWSWGKSKLTDKKSKWYQKILWSPIVIGAVGVTAATRGISAGASALKTASDKEKQRQAHEEKVGGFVDSLKRGFKSAKASFQDLFNEE